MPVANPAGDKVVELVRGDLLGGGSPSDPQVQRIAFSRIAVEMHTVSARSKEWNGTPIEPKDRRHSPARGDVKRLVAPFRDTADGEDVGEPPQRRGIVAAQQPDPRTPGGQRHDARRIVVVAGVDVVAE